MVSDIQTCKYCGHTHCIINGTAEMFPVPVEIIRKGCSAIADDGHCIRAPMDYQEGETCLMRVEGKKNGDSEKMVYRVCCYQCPKKEECGSIACSTLNGGRH